jgi:hypothetical protein
MVGLLLVSQREAQQQQLPRQSTLTPPAAQTRLQRFRKSRACHFLVRSGQLVLLLLTLGQAVYTFYGPFWPTKPEIQFHDTIDSSSFVLPFKMTNKSILFSVNNAEITCSVDLMYFMDNDGKTGLLRSAIFNPGPISIGRDDFTNYPCTASDYVRIRPDGSLIMGFENGRT